MPGRQAHGRPLVSAKNGSGAAKKRQSRTKTSSKALNAYAAAQAEVGDQQKRTQRNRQLDADLNDGATHGKHGRDDEDGDEDEDEDDAPPRKMRRGEDQDVEYGSDSSGNSWRVGAVDEDDDSEIDSDEAFGESDEERFEDFKFPGSKKNKKNKKKQVQEVSLTEPLGNILWTWANCVPRTLTMRKTTTWTTLMGPHSVPML